MFINRRLTVLVCILLFSALKLEAARTEFGTVMAEAFDLSQLKGSELAEKYKERRSDTVCLVLAWKAHILNFAASVEKAEDWAIKAYNYLISNSSNNTIRSLANYLASIIRSRDESTWYDLTIAAHLDWEARDCARDAGFRMEELTAFFEIEAWCSKIEARLEVARFKEEWAEVSSLSKELKSRLQERRDRDLATMPPVETQEADPFSIAGRWLRREFR